MSNRSDHNSSPKASWQPHLQPTPYPRELPIDPLPSTEAYIYEPLDAHWTLNHHPAAQNQYLVPQHVTGGSPSLRPSKFFATSIYTGQIDSRGSTISLIPSRVHVESALGAFERAPMNGDTGAYPGHSSQPPAGMPTAAFHPNMMAHYRHPGYFSQPDNNGNLLAQNIQTNSLHSSSIPNHGHPSTTVLGVDTTPPALSSDSASGIMFDYSHPLPNHSSPQTQSTRHMSTIGNNIGYSSFTPPSPASEDVHYYSGYYSQAVHPEGQPIMEDSSASQASSERSASPALSKSDKCRFDLARVPKDLCDSFKILEAFIKNSKFYQDGDLEPSIEGAEDILSHIQSQTGIRLGLANQPKDSIYSVFLEHGTKKCLLCGYLNNAPDRRIGHIRTAFEHKPFRCPGEIGNCYSKSCKTLRGLQGFPTDAALSEHLKLQGIKEYCPICGKSFRPKGVRRHIKTVHFPDTARTGNPKKQKGKGV